MILALMSLFVGLLDRQIEVPAPGAACALILFAEDQGALEAFSRKLEVEGPVAVLAPDNPYAGYGIQATGRGGIGVFRFNWLIRSHAEALRAGGKFPEGEDELTLSLAWTAAGVTPNRGDAVAWATELLREQGIEPVYEPAGPGDAESWEAWIAMARATESGYDPAAVLARLESFGVKGALP